MQVIGDGADVGVGVRVEVAAGLPQVAGAGNHMEGVGDDAGLDDGLAVLVEIQTPWVGRAVRDHLEDMPRGMVPPDAGVDGNALGIGRAGFAHAAVGEHAVAAPQPTIRAPDEGVQRLVGVLQAPTVEQNLRFTGRLVAAGIQRNIQQLGGGTDPNAAMTHLQAADQIQVFHEDGALVELPVTISVFQDHNTIQSLAGRALLRVAVGLGDPHPAAVVQRHGHGLVHIGLTCE